MVTREAVLDEIRRQTALAGGVTPGQASFARLTGLSHHLWKGKYWARWTDAVLEAGLEPNATPGRLHTDDEALERIGEFALSLGRLPTMAELNVRGREVADFPGIAVVRKRFGGIDGVTTALRDFAASNEAFHDLLPLVATTPRVGKSNQESESLGVVGYVYLMKSGKHYKIGRSNDVGRRLYDLRIQLAEAPTTVHIIETDDPVGIENYWHQRFADKRMNGEWFNLTADDIAVFKRRRKFM